jgi:hypothetical protein
VTCILANLALRHNATLSWDERKFTVGESAVAPYLKAEYRAPWKLEV